MAVILEHNQSDYELGYDQAIGDVVEVLTPIITSFDSYRASGNVIEVLRDLEGLVDEIHILHRRNKL